MASDRYNQNVKGPNLGEDLLGCTICYDRLKSPKILQCLHTFCETCLERHFGAVSCQFKPVPTFVSCPNCRELTYLPKGGIPGLRYDVAVEKTSVLLEKIQTLLDDVYRLKGDEDDVNGVYNAVFAAEFAKEEHAHLLHLLEVLVSKMAESQTKMSQLVMTEKVMRKELADMMSAPETPAHSTNSATPQQTPVKQNASKDREMKLDEKYHPVFARLSSAQDKLYSRYASLKCLHNVAEAVLSKCPDDQVKAVCGDLICMIERVLKEDEKIPADIDALVLEADAEGAASALLDFGLKTGPKEATFEKVKVKLLWQVGARGTSSRMFQWPVHAAVVQGDRIIVADKNNSRLQVFDMEGNYFTSFGQNMVKPKRIAVNSDGVVYVSDELSECVKMFNEHGCLVSRWGESLFKNPAGIAINSEGNIVMSDAERCFISIHTPSGILLTKFTSRMLEDTTVPNPYFLTVNADDNIIVSDSYNSCVKVFSKTGQPMYRFGKGRLKCPRGIAVDQNGNILVVDSDNHRVLMFDPFGKYLCEILTRLDGLCYPMGLTLSKDDKLLITQCGFYGGHELRVYQLQTEDDSEKFC
ncbi:tripartite motif-containing protein 2-like [Lineus longissimus]|uniref:tripartite motif-containing protein 2-like n=1 Tax=Lineus longissimus TaxID=88925 RepID=UPI00315DB064